MTSSAIESQAPAPQLLQRINELEQRCAGQAHLLDSARAQLAALGDIAAAAADGETLPAQRYQVAGLLGLRQLEPGDAVLSFEMRDVLPHAEQHVWIARRPPRPMLVRRLYVELALAPSFRLRSVNQNHYVILGEGGHPESIPCELLSTRYGAPLLDWKFGTEDSVSITVTNISARKLHFRLLMLGYWLDAGPA